MVMGTSDLSPRELEALFDQSPVAMLFSDRELRTRRANAAFRQLTTFADEMLTGLKPSQTRRADRLIDTELIERTLADQVISRGIPVVCMKLEESVAGKRRVYAWTAYRVTDGDRVLGAVSSFADITGLVQTPEEQRQANARLDLLQRASSQIGTTLDIHRTAQELAALALPALADRVTVDLLEPALQDEDPAGGKPGELRFRRVTVRDAATTATISFAEDDLVTLQVTRQPAAAFLREEPLLARNPAEMRQAGLDPAQVQALLDRGVHSLVTVPLTARGATLGIAGFCRAENPEPYNADDVLLVSALAARAAVHIDNARLYTREHDAAITLQRSLLPRDIPRVPGLDIAYRYQPASQAAVIGGDWFDVIPLDHGQVALGIGDVTGHGIRAAAIMGQLRTTTAALARLHCPPEQIMDQLSDVLTVHGNEAEATCLHAVYDPASRRCRLTNAGHLPPALRHPDGTVELIDLPPGLLLGAGRGYCRAIDRQLPPGSILALYTDGLIEKPGEDISTGLSRLADALAEGPAQSLDDLCDDILARLAPRPRDDIALLLARPY